MMILRVIISKFWKLVEAAVRDAGVIVRFNDI